MEWIRSGTRPINFAPEIVVRIFFLLPLSCRVQKPPRLQVISGVCCVVSPAHRASEPEFRSISSAGQWHVCESSWCGSLAVRVIYARLHSLQQLELIIFSVGERVWPLAVIITGDIIGIPHRRGAFQLPLQSQFMEGTCNWNCAAKGRDEHGKWLISVSRRTSSVEVLLAISCKSSPLSRLILDSSSGRVSLMIGFWAHARPTYGKRPARHCRKSISRAGLLQ